MDRKSKLRQIALAAFIVMGAAAQSVTAQPLPNNGVSAAANGVVSQPGTMAPLPVTPQAGQAQTTALTPDVAKQSAAGNVAELQQMIRGSDLSELRTTYNGSYGASLLFYGKEMTYYVALFQQKNFWRVIKTQDVMRAEMIYKDFVRQTVQLSDVEIRRTQLEAQKIFTERMIALSQDSANRLQAGSGAQGHFDDRQPTFHQCAGERHRILHLVDRDDGNDRGEAENLSKVHAGAPRKMLAPASADSTG